MQIAQNGTAIEIRAGSAKGEVIRKASPRHGIAILEKVVDRTRNNTVVIVAAGLGVVGTVGAIQYLIDHWGQRSRMCDTGFAVALQFGPVPEYISQAILEDIIRQPAVIRRIPEQLEPIYRAVLMHGQQSSRVLLASNRWRRGRMHHRWGVQCSA